MIKKSKLNKQSQRELLMYALLGFSVGAFLFSCYHFVTISFFQRSNNAKINNKPSITPYYESSAFENKPTIMSATQSGGMDNPIKIPIIMYHYVEYVKDPGDTIRQKLNTTPLQFEKELISLKKNNYDTYFVKDIPDIINGTIDYSTRSVVLTFDDGYRDFYDNAFPLLQKYHMRGTVYIIQSNIGKPDFLSHQQIQDMIDSQLVEIGSHTLTHAYLKTMSDSAAWKQIIESKQKLEEEFNTKIETFAYPNGVYNPKTIDLVKEASYSAAVSVISGTIQSQNNLFYLSRIRPGILTGDAVRVIEGLNK